MQRILVKLYKHRITRDYVTTYSIKRHSNHFNLHGKGYLGHYMASLICNAFQGHSLKSVTDCNEVETSVIQDIMTMDLLPKHFCTNIKCTRFLATHVLDVVLRTLLRMGIHGTLNTRFEEFGTATIIFFTVLGYFHQENMSVICIPP